MLISSPSFAGESPLTSSITFSTESGLYFIGFNCEAATFMTPLNDLKIIVVKEELSCNWDAYQGSNQDDKNILTWVGTYQGKAQAVCCLNNLNKQIKILTAKGYKEMTK